MCGLYKINNHILFLYNEEDYKEAGVTEEYGSITVNYNEYNAKLIS